MLVLASQSPRRRELLALAGFDFIVRARPVAEIRKAGESPADYVRRLAREKAEAAQRPITNNAAQRPITNNAAQRPITDDAAQRPITDDAAQRPITNDAAQRPIDNYARETGPGFGEEILLGADTVVVLGDRVLEKPADQADARSMLRALSGRDHLVMTGVALLRGERAIADVETTRVHFAEWSLPEIDDYVATGEPMDKAGAYAIQGLASKFVDRIEGCYFNVMGLPLAMVYRHWKTLVQE